LATATVRTAVAGAALGDVVGLGDACVAVLPPAVAVEVIGVAVDTDALDQRAAQRLLCRHEGGVAGEGERGRGAPSVSAPTHSKDEREGLLPQVVIGMAVTRSGIPIRVWCWLGNTTDVTVMAQVRAELLDWKLTRLVSVTDRGFASAANRRLLQRGGSHYIQVEKQR
jgi:hypothetical protein